MWHIESFAGLLMLAKYVSNWYSVLAVYFKILPMTKARFKDGIEIPVSNNDSDVFHEELFKRYLQDKGFTYSMEQGKKAVHTPDGLRILYSKIPYSFVLNEVFVAKVYGANNLKGRVVIDAGTYFSDSPLYFASRGASKVYGFEPDIDNYNLGQENIKLNSMMGKVHIYNQVATFESIKSLIERY